MNRTRDSNNDNYQSLLQRQALLRENRERVCEIPRESRAMIIYMLRN